jgi:hypothetical protein
LFEVAMGISEQRRPSPAAEYYYRRALGLADLLKAAAVGVGAGLAAFYVAHRLLERTPLVVDRTSAMPERAPRRRRRDAAGRPGDG